MASSFRVADIVAHPTLDTRVTAGSGGLDREVLWAHSCEKPDPARWLGPHELLMTIGLCIPKGASAQRDLIASLDEAGVAGMAVAEDHLTPSRLSAGMLAEADARKFPILITGATTPFAAIGRTVAAANADQQTMQVLLLAKLYQIAGQRDGSRRSSASLEDLFNTQLTVVDSATGCVVIGSGVLGPSHGRSYQLHTHRPTHLVVDADSGLDAFSLVHLTQVLAVDANVLLQEAETSAQNGSAALDGALKNSSDGLASISGLWSSSDEAYRVIVTSSDSLLRVPLAVALRGLAALVTEDGDRVVIACPERELPSMRGLLAELELPAAASGLHYDLRDISGALAEASSELTLPSEDETLWREYRGHRVSLLARSHSEAAEIVRSVLGPLCADDAQAVTLRDTLFAFIDHDMRWKETAQALRLHRQTVVYRLNQVETLTGRSVRRAKDLAEFWLARSAWEQYASG